MAIYHVVLVVDPEVDLPSGKDTVPIQFSIMRSAAGSESVYSNGCWGTRLRVMSLLNSLAMEA